MFRVLNEKKNRSITSVDDHSHEESAAKEDENSFENTLARLRDKQIGTVADVVIIIIKTKKNVGPESC